MARFGGEEFAIVFVNIDASEVAIACERVRQTIAGAGWSELDPKLAVTASIGFCHFEEARESIEELIKIAGARLFQAKRTGRNRAIGP